MSGPAFDYAKSFDDGRIEFDVEAFSRDLIAVCDDPAADLAAWLRHHASGWPEELRSALAPRLIQSLDDEAVAISPRHFSVFIAALRLDDALIGATPAVMERLRAANARRRSAREAAARGRRLLAPENRDELALVMRRVGYPVSVTRAIAHMLTSRHGSTWVALARWAPFVASRVMKMLRHISGGAFQTLAPPLDVKVLVGWANAERFAKQARRVGLIVGSGVATVLLVAYATGIDLRTLEPHADQDALALQQVQAIWGEEAAQPQKAVDDYTAFIAANSPPRSQFVAQDVSNAMFNRGIVLGKLGRAEEAERSYQALDEAFGNSNDASVKITVAQGMNNWAYSLGRRDAYKQVVSITQRLVARYPAVGDEDKGPASFDVQIARALINQANALEHLGEKDATLVACRELLVRFKDARSEDLKGMLQTARDIEDDYRPARISPGGGPFSLGGLATPPTLPKLSSPGTR